MFPLINHNLPQCKHCPRDGKHPFDMFEYCDWHWELDSRCQICFQYHDTSTHSQEKSEICLSYLCSGKAELPRKDPKLCLECFKKMSHGSFARCDKVLLNIGVDRCSHCFQFTIQGTFSTNPLPSCVTCGLESCCKNLTEYLPITIVNITKSYLWSTLEVGSILSGRSRVITHVDFQNGLYHLTDVDVDSRKKLPHCHHPDSCVCKYQSEMAIIHTILECFNLPQ